MRYLLILSLTFTITFSSWLGGGCPAAGSTCSCSIPCASYLESITSLTGLFVAQCSLVVREQRNSVRNEEAIEGMSGGFGPGGGGLGAGAYATGVRGAGSYATPPYRSKRGERFTEDDVEEESSFTGDSPFRSRAHGSKIERDPELEGFSDDHLCNSPTLRKILKTNIVENADQSRNLIQKALRSEGRHDFVVICTPNPFGFTATRDTEYCSVSSVVHSCYVFAF